ncbi:hypothetical protein B0H15DRAFT_653988 [Mycena belliarum]|uniref:Uncharacterized protein n=1 Tax=Mycena belliarum TaxID=1033014 RepID=A0AAD6XFB7_9AGAR|nr:hypothetical protein B0H15DRAFT_653988 [Mycena belliae]
MSPGRVRSPPSSPSRIPRLRDTARERPPYSTRTSLLQVSRGPDEYGRSMVRDTRERRVAAPSLQSRPWPCDEARPRADIRPSRPPAAHTRTQASTRNVPHDPHWRHTQREHWPVGVQRRALAPRLPSPFPFASSFPLPLSLLAPVAPVFPRRHPISIRFTNCGPRRVHCLPAPRPILLPTSPSAASPPSRVPRPFRPLALSPCVPSASRRCSRGQKQGGVQNRRQRMRARPTPALCLPPALRILLRPPPHIRAVTRHRDTGDDAARAGLGGTDTDTGVNARHRRRGALRGTRTRGLDARMGPAAPRRAGRKRRRRLPWRQRAVARRTPRATIGTKESIRGTGRENVETMRGVEEGVGRRGR